nr:RidA family protein [uncultured Hyphomonas sp.]
MKSMFRTGGVAAMAASMMALGGCVVAGVEDVGQAHATDVEYYSAPTVAGMDLPFSKAVRVDDTIYLSGELGIDPETNDFAPGGAGPQTTQIFENIERTLGKFDADLADVVKCSVFLGDMQNYGEMNAAYDAALPDPKPARSTFGAGGLAMGAALEIECIAVKK